MNVQLGYGEAIVELRVELHLRVAQVEQVEQRPRRLDECDHLQRAYLKSN